MDRGSGSRQKHTQPGRRREEKGREGNVKGQDNSEKFIILLISCRPDLLGVG